MWRLHNRHVVTGKEATSGKSTRVSVCMKLSGGAARTARLSRFVLGRIGKTIVSLAW